MSNLIKPINIKRLRNNLKQSVIFYEVINNINNLLLNASLNNINKVIITSDIIQNIKSEDIATYYKKAGYQICYCTTKEFKILF